MWAAVQKVSRPIVRCHEMSQIPPTTTLVEAKTTAQTYQGTPWPAAAAAGAPRPEASGSEPGIVVLSAVAVTLTVVSPTSPPPALVYLLSAASGIPLLDPRNVRKGISVFTLDDPADNLSSLGRVPS